MSRAAKSEKGDTPALTPAVNSVLDQLVNNPEFASPLVTRDVVRSLLLYTEGWTMVRGYRREIAAKHVAAGIYRVKLSPSRDKGPQA